MRERHPGRGESEEYVPRGQIYTSGGNERRRFPTVRSVPGVGAKRKPCARSTPPLPGSGAYQQLGVHAAVAEAADGAAPTEPRSVTADQASGLVQGARTHARQEELDGSGV